jgi:hypothetical protein
MKRAHKSSTTDSSKKKKKARTTEGKVPSLATLAHRACATQFKSREARYWAEKEEFPHDIELHAMAKDAEAAHLPHARGHIYTEETKRPGDGLFPTWKVNELGKIDGARLADFDPETRTVTIRVDHSTHLDFYLELKVGLDQLEQFCGRFE